MEEVVHWRCRFGCSFCELHNFHFSPSDNGPNNDAKTAPLLVRGRRSKQTTTRLRPRESGQRDSKKKMKEESNRRSPLPRPDLYIFSRLAFSPSLRVRQKNVETLSSPKQFGRHSRSSHEQSSNIQIKLCPDQVLNMFCI